jgi:hypothetical protein
MTWILRLAALMGAGAYGVHQLRYVLSPQDAASLRAHGYLAPVGAVVVGLLLFALAAALARIARGAVDEVPRAGRLWAGASASLVAVYCVQETIEQLLTSGERTGVLAHGGWVAAPLAVAIGLAIALLMRGTAAASEVAAARERRIAPALAVGLAPFVALPAPWSPRRSHGAARHEAARGPPAASASA